MANTNSANSNDPKKIPKPIKSSESLLLTEEEFSRRQHLRTKERIDRITRIFGVFAILVVAYAGIFDTLFEISTFGYIFDREAFVAIWDQILELRIFDDAAHFGIGMAEFGITLVFIFAILGCIYLITYSIVDVIDMIRGVYKSGLEIGKDINATLKDTVEVSKTAEDIKTTKAKKKNNLFSAEELEQLKGEKTEKNEEKENTKKKKETKRRTESYTPGELSDLSSDQLDALLRGDVVEEDTTADLFAENENRQ